MRRKFHWLGYDRKIFKSHCFKGKQHSRLKQTSAPDVRRAQTDTCTAHTLTKMKQTSLRFKSGMRKLEAVEAVLFLRKRETSTASAST